MHYSIYNVRIDIYSCRLHGTDSLGDVEAELVLGQPLAHEGLLLALRREVGDANLGLGEGRMLTKLDKKTLTGKFACLPVPLQGM